MALLHKSENYLRQMPDDKPTNLAALVIPNKGESEDTHLQLKIIKSQLNRIEEQNNLILSSLKK